MQVAVLHVQMPVPQHRLVGEAHHAVDLLPAQRVAEHTHRALFDERRPIVHIRQRLHAHLTRQRAAGAGMVAAQHARDVIGRLSTTRALRRVWVSGSGSTSSRNPNCS